MSKIGHQRYPSMDTTREPHAISLKVLRLSRPGLSRQFPLNKPTTAAHHNDLPVPMAASLASATLDSADPTAATSSLFSPITSLPQSFGAAYVGETFSCTLCANNDTVSDAILAPLPTAAGGASGTLGTGRQKQIRNVKIKAEMKTPGTGAPVHKLILQPADPGATDDGKTEGVDLPPGKTLQKIILFDLREEGNHVLAVSVSYYETTETSGRQRTFRKLYQFMCKSALVVRTKTGPLGNVPGSARRWVLEAQLENSGEMLMMLERVGLDVEGDLLYDDCNWEVTCDEKEGARGKRPILRPKEVEQICFVVREGKVGSAEVNKDGRVVLGGLSISWRGEMGSHGLLTTGKLNVRSR